MVSSVPYPRLLFSLWALALLSTRGVLALDEVMIGGPLHRDENDLAAENPLWSDDGDDEFNNCEDWDIEELEELLSLLADVGTFAKNVREGGADSKTSLGDLRVRGARVLALLRGDDGEEKRGHENAKRRLVRMLQGNLSEKLKKCRDDRKTCNQDLVALRREKNKVTRDLDQCVADRASCDDRVDSLKDAQRRASGNFRRCQIREDQCEADLEECRGTYEIRDCSSYGNVVTVDDPADFCGATLEENTAYLLAGDVACNGSGTTLSSNVCLDCRGSSIKGNGAGDGMFYGIDIASSATDVVIRNCVIENFANGIHNSGGDAFISNVRSRENSYSGIYKSGGNTRIECSIMNDNAIGIFSWGQTINIAGCLMENNFQDGVAFDSDYESGSAVVSCSEILSNGDYGLRSFSNANEVIIRDTIVADSRYNSIDVSGSETSVILTNVAACNAGDNDIAASSNAFRFASYDELTCDKIYPSSVATCAYQCPADSWDSSSLRLPQTCPICPNGVGPYTPP